MMRHPYEKLIKIEIATILLAILIGMLAIIKGVLTLVFISLLLLTLSLLAEALSALSTHQRFQGIKQLIRSAIIFILTIYMFLRC